VRKLCGQQDEEPAVLEADGGEDEPDEDEGEPDEDDEPDEDEKN
jgi:hypothetical protein